MTELTERRAVGAPDPCPSGSFPMEVVPESVLHKVFRASQRWTLTHGREVNALHVGEPAYGMPPSVVDAMTDAIVSGDTAYTSAEGSPELRDALTAKLVRQGLDVSPDQVFVAPGSCQGLSAVGKAVHTPGAAWLIPQVHWPIYRQQGAVNSYETLAYPLGEHYGLDVDAIAKSATPQTRVIVVNSPANPTGAVADDRDRRDLLTLATERNWIVISDEAYEDFVYDGKHTPLATLEADTDPDERRVFSAFTFSKSHAMTGCRVGYVVAPNDRFAALLRKVQEATIIAPPTPAQRGALAALNEHEAVRENVAQVQASRDAIMPELVAAGLIDVPPAGGWYALLNIDRSGLRAQQFSDRLLAERGVGVAPAAAFAVDGDPIARDLIRISMAGDRELLVEGVQAIIQACHEWGDPRDARSEGTT
ncbi:pyridoxal phosphate-dependent aminotransferase [Solicola gregarius]|uniref:Pyridoxal phosphate-dependent aminotransferase n=1 Tax=Solicola gregarius TaxID=2908642 RepID=A0AA46TE44_9ACTN|nr:pyridoxal phosphate-dependent aminotransferase [Solicola gregarius]UYM03646.1 pyridoxal phosphate-dependent aminotransferase [Solicola gregarius]